MKAKILTAVKVVFFLSIGIALIFLFTQQFGETEKQEIWDAVVNAKYSWILFSMVLGTASHLSRAMRWKQLLEPVGHNPSTRNTFFAIMVMYFANLAVPRLGEVSRCAILKRYENVPMEKAFGTVVAERAIDLIVLGFIFLFTLLFQWDLVMEGFETLKTIGGSENPEEKSMLLPIIAGIGLLGAALLFLLRKNKHIQKIYNKVVALALGFADGIKAAFQVKKPMVFVLHSLFIWLMYFSMVYVCYFAMPETANLPIASGFTILIFGSVGIILVPGGIGIYPLIVAKVLLLYGVAEIYGYSFGWIIWIGQTAMLLAWGLISLILLPIFNKKSDRDAKIAAQQS